MSTVSSDAKQTPYTTLNTQGPSHKSASHFLPTIKHGTWEWLCILGVLNVCLSEDHTSEVQTQLLSFYFLI